MYNTDETCMWCRFVVSLLVFVVLAASLLDVYIQYSGSTSLTTGMCHSYQIGIGGHRSVTPLLTKLLFQ